MAFLFLNSLRCNETEREMVEPSKADDAGSIPAARLLFSTRDFNLVACLAVPICDWEHMNRAVVSHVLPKKG